MQTHGELPQTIGKYEVLGVIGRGGMGVVYSARDPFIDRVVAIKTIRIDAEDDDDQLGRLRMEARSAGKLQHPNIVTVFEFGEQQHLSYIVMEYVQGINLSAAVAQRKIVPLAGKLEILMQVASGLAYAHECGVVHRDMKPSNICVTERGVAKILDFGLARFDNTRLTKTGYLSGTIAYMSPERFSGETGPQDDIFALGAVAYELLAYQRAFPGETTPEIISKILGGSMPTPISELTGYPRALDSIILRALDRDPVERFSNATEFELAIEEFTCTDEYQKFIADEKRLPEFQQPVDWNDDTVQSTTNPYSSARSLSSVPLGEAPTLVVASDNAPYSGTQVDIPAGEPTRFTTKAGADLRPPRAALRTRQAVAPLMQEAAPTEIVAQPKGRKFPLVAGAIGVLVAVVAAVVLITQRKTATVQPQTLTQTVAPAPATQTVVVNDGNSRQWEVELATAKTLADLVARRKLTGDEKKRFADANGRLGKARTLVAQKDFAGGAALAKDATDTLRELLAQEGNSSVSSGTAPPRAPAPPTTRKPKPFVMAKTETAAPVPVPVPAPVPASPPPQAAPPAVVVAAQPPSAPQKPSRADLEREIHAFMRETAAAYQDKDVGFFRKRALNFSDQLANAIRDSPSTRVDIAVRSIQFIDDANANVVARRTDTFAEAGTPPGVQMLVYELRRTQDGWKIVRFSRG